MKRGIVYLLGNLIWLLVLGVSPASAQNVITTVAGTPWVFRGSGGLAVNAPLGQVRAVAVDPAGNFFVADQDNNLVMKISPNGLLTVVAGNGIRGYSGDNGPATSASLYDVYDIEASASGILYIADWNNNRVRKVSPDGIITTVAGSGGMGFAGDGGPATAALLRNPIGLALAPDGSLYVSDSGNNRVRKISPGGIMSTVAGNGTAGFSGDGGPATAATLSSPGGLACDSRGNLYIADRGNYRIRRIDPSGTITTVAGGGSSYPGNGGPATGAMLAYPDDVAADTSGNLYIAQSACNCIGKVSAGGTINTAAGTRASGFSGDGGAATAATFQQPKSVAVDTSGNLYIADWSNWRIRRVATDGIVTTVAGNGLFGASGDGGPATSASLSQPAGISLDRNGNLYVADSENQRIRKVSSSGIMTTIAGTGMWGFYSGEGGPATSATLHDPQRVVSDSAGNVYFSDTHNSRVRKVGLDGSITTVAGGGSANPGDGGLGTNAYLVWPYGLAFDGAGNLFIADWGANRVRKLSPAGIITTVAGNGTTASSGDGGPATSASLAWPNGVAVDSASNVYISEEFGGRVRRVSAGGTITTVAGGGTAYDGDGGPATSASLPTPKGLAVDGMGNLYIADYSHHKIRRVAPTGIISTVAGTGVGGYSGDGVPATQAKLNHPSDIALDGSGNLYIADTDNSRIRKVLTTAPTFTATPARLSFSVEFGAAAIGAQQLAVSGTVAGLAWSALASTQSGGNWLAVSPAAGGAVPGIVAVSVDVSQLAAGTYQGTVTIQAPLAVPSTQTVAVELTVTAALPAQLAEPSSLTFEASPGAISPPARTLRIASSGGQALNWTARAETGSGGPWLSLSPASGSATAGSPSALQVSVNLTGLAAGTYSGAVIVTSGSQTIKVGVTLLVSTVTQTILVSQAGLLFTGVQGGGAVPSQSIGILNTGQGTMSWTVEAATLRGGNWLTVTPANGTSNASSTQVPLVEVGTNVNGLSAGQYSGLIQVRSTGANNSPQIVSVELKVLPAGSNPGPLVRPTGLIFATRAGSSSPGSQTVRVATAVPGNVEFGARPATLSGGEWLEALPQNAVVAPGTPTDIVVQPTLGTLTPGVYRGGLTLLFGDGSPLQGVDVLFLVVPLSTSSASGLSLLARDEGATLFDGSCTATKLLALLRSLRTGFAAPVGSPTPIEVQVVDDCATAITDATVMASFSSGDAPLVMTSLRNGTYVGTWRPASTAAAVTVTVRATLPPLTRAEVQAQGQVSGSSTAPLLPTGGIVNAASYAPAAALAPGSIVSAFGQNLATGLATSGLPLETTLGGATLNIGGIDAPLFYSNTGQINAQLPFNLTPNSRPQAYIRLRTTSGAEMISVPETFTIVATQPGIFTMNQSGSGQGAIIDMSWKLVDSSNPAKAGDWVQIFATGLGLVTPSVAAGQAAPVSPLSETTVPVTVTIDGKAATVGFAGLAPYFAGLYQVNVQIPEGVTAGNAVPVILTQGGVSSNTATLAIR